MPETTGNKSAYGAHAKTEPIAVRNLRRGVSPQTQLMPIVSVLPPGNEVEVVSPSWSVRHYEAFRWFGLVLNYLAYAFVIAFISLVMTRGLILIWEAWLRDLGN
jgi:hypothetical protein